MTPSGILETALYVDDLDEAETFYTEVMGLERIAKVDGRHVFFRCGEGVLLLFDPEGRGIVIEADFEWPQGGRSIYFRDPAGNSIEIANPKIWGL
jgi:catechol 2,3-dioxygenase-like lactoylglutathione lyase family enzyme